MTRDRLHLVSRALPLGLLVVFVLLLAGPALAHPLGNFTVNTAVRGVVGTDTLDLRYVLDLAEIPTVQARPSIDLDDDDQVDDVEAERYRRERCAELLDGVTVRAGDRRVELAPTSSTLEFPDGEAGLVTTRLVCDATGALPAPSYDLIVEDRNDPDRIGWRETTLVGDGVTLDGLDVPTASRTDLLRDYPEDVLADPERTTSATASVVAGGPAAGDDALDGDVVDELDGGEGEGAFERLSASYTDLVARNDLTLGFAVLAFVLAMGLGSLHAIAPGHGKTVMAAYVVGQRGTGRQALAIGATVAATHTIGVLVLGLVLSASETLAPESLYPWFGAISGALIVTIGIGLVRSALRARRGRAGAGDSDHHRHHADHHHHDHADHDHDDHGHDAVGEVVERMSQTTVIHHHGHSHVIPDPGLGWRGLVTLGVAGGLAPSPSALLVLLGAIALGRTWFGVVLVSAYGMGLALVLVLGGLALVHVRGLADRVVEHATVPRVRRLLDVLPLVTGVFVVGGGVVVALRGLLL